METQIAVFSGKESRKPLHNNEWWFVIGDVVEAVTDMVNSFDYMKKMRKREAELAKGGYNLYPSSNSGVGMVNFRKGGDKLPPPF